MKLSNEIKVALLTIASLVVLVVGYNFLRGADLFSTTFHYYAVYQKVDGLAVSKPVLVNGFQVGRVADMRLLPNGEILTRFDVDKNYRVPANTVARLESQDLLQNKAIVFVLGNSERIAKNNDTLANSTEKSLSEVVAPLQVKTEKLLSRIDSVLGSVNAIINPRFQKNIDRGINSLAGTLENFEALSKKADGLIPHANAILKNFEDLSANLKKNNANISAILTNTKAITEHFSNLKVEETLGKATKAVANLDAAIEKINSGQGSLGALINDKGLYNNLNASSVSLNNLLVDLKANPKRYVSFSIFGGGRKKSKTGK